ncbi:hypothetical protein P7K49_016845 [Saguinus oedipus]|uniref:Uncharacterized protein n=1 Tax=Saguinus oedipus TaxID=9490 RepID=A0ABQ9VDU4_SAGOE|nr:hypothetical protein P7K49_016845 [Saguinus oedipus]
MTLGDGVMGNTGLVIARDERGARELADPGPILTVLTRGTKRVASSLVGDAFPHYDEWIMSSGRFGS